MRTAAFVTTPVERLCVPAPTATVALAADTVSTRWPVTFTIAAVYLCSQCPCCLRSVLFCFIGLSGITDYVKLACLVCTTY